MEPYGNDSPSKVFYLCTFSQKRPHCSPRWNKMWSSQWERWIYIYKKNGSVLLCYRSCLTFREIRLFPLFLAQRSLESRFVNVFATHSYFSICEVKCGGGILCRMCSKVSVIIIIRIESAEQLWLHVSAWRCRFVFFHIFPSRKQQHKVNIVGQRCCEARYLHRWCQSWIGTRPARQRSLWQGTSTAEPTCHLYPSSYSGMRKMVVWACRMVEEN